FLGRAIDASLRGDRDVARHLSYYAELRAAMALLASEGLAIFDKKHFVVDATGSPSQIPNSVGTHAMVWQLLAAWCQLPKAASLVGQIIVVEGISLATWLGHFGLASNTALQPVAADWLKTWGLDLKQLGQDRAARNESSYRPTALNRAAAVNTKRCLEIV